MDILRGSILEIQRDIKAARASGYATQSRSKKIGGDRETEMQVSEMEVEIRG